MSGRQRAATPPILVEPEHRFVSGLTPACRRPGRKGGRPNALDKRKQALLYQLYDERKYSVKQMCEMLGISKPTLYAYLDQRKAVQ